MAELVDYLIPVVEAITNMDRMIAVELIVIEILYVINPQVLDKRC